MKEQVKSQNAKVKRQNATSLLLTFAFCVLTFDLLFLCVSAPLW